MLVNLFCLKTLIMPYSTLSTLPKPAHYSLISTKNRILQTCLSKFSIHKAIKIVHYKVRLILPTTLETKQAKTPHYNRHCCWYFKEYYFNNEIFRWAGMGQLFLPVYAGELYELCTHLSTVLNIFNSLNIYILQVFVGQSISRADSTRLESGLCDLRGLCDRNRAIWFKCKIVDKIFGNSHSERTNGNKKKRAKLQLKAIKKAICE